MMRLFAAVAVLAAPCFQQQAPRAVDLIPREALFGNPERANPQISPDGKKLAWLAPDEGVLNVWVRTFGATDDRPVTSDRKRGIRTYFWQQDSDHVLFLQDTGGDENWRLYQASLATKKTRDLTPFDKVQAQVVAASPRVPGAVLVGLNKRNPQLHDVHRLDLATGALALDTENPGDVIGWTADEELRVRACECMAPDGGAVIRVRDAVDAPWREFQRWSPDDSFGSIAGFSGDGKTLRLISSLDAETGRLIEADVATGATRVIAEDPRYDAGAVMTNPKTAKLEAVQFRRARNDWKSIDPAIEADFAALRKVKDGDFSVTSRDDEDKTWIVAFVVDDAPVQYFSWNREARKAEFLFTNRPKLEKFTLSKMKPVSFPARDGLKLEGYLTTPAGAPEGRLPLVLNVHGGPWARDSWGLNNEVQWLANRGYAVLQVNFRGSTGYGKKHVNAGDREWGGKMHDDLIDAVKWAIDGGVADPKRVAIYGGSYGGYSALVGAAFTPDVFACAVDIVGPSSIVTLIKNIPPYWKPFIAVFNRRVGSLEKDEAFLHARSPLSKVDEIRIPLLVAQGANDPRVKQSESEAIVAAVRKKGKDVEYLLFPDEGHGFAQPDNRMAYYASAEGFLAKHLGGRAQAPTEAEAKKLAAVRK
ncbi:MAG TPA: S9 family peptidase [Planctomycetota bacterium]|nr:S9 family peptidase [Planctomycetota bacterium]